MTYESNRGEGVKDAQVYLVMAQIYYFGTPEIKRDMRKAMEFLEKASQLGISCKQIIFTHQLNRLILIHFKFICFTQAQTRLLASWESCT